MIAVNGNEAEAMTKLIQENFHTYGMCLKQIYHPVQTRSFDDLIRTIDEADRKAPRERAKIPATRS